MKISPPPIRESLIHTKNLLSIVWTQWLSNLSSQSNAIQDDIDVLKDKEVDNLLSTSTINLDKRLEEIESQLSFITSFKNYDSVIEELRLLSTMQSQQRNLYGWEDLRVPVNSVKVGATKVPTLTSYKGGHVYAFADQAIEGNEEQVTFVCQIPHAYKQGSSIYPHVHWVGQDNTAGNVRWKLTYSWANINSAFPAESTIYIDGANSTTTDNHNKTEFAAIVGTGKTISSMLICSLTRNSSHVNDTFTGKSAYLLEFDFHVEMDDIGSNTELVK